MKEYFLYVDEKTIGPLPQDEIEAKIKSGEFDQDVLIAAEGDEEWKPAKEVLGVRRGVRLSRKTAAEEQEMRAARQEKLDPDIRKKLMRYNLADAISVDKFSPEQAQKAVEIYEKNVAKQKYMKIGVGVLSFLVAFGIVFSILQNVKLSGVYRGLLAPITELMKAPNPDYPAQARSITREIADLEQVRADAKNAEFKQITGKDPRQTFLQRVEIPNEERQILSATVDVSGFIKLAVPEGKEIGDVEIFFAPKVSSGSRKALQEEIDMLQLLKTPLWSDAVLSQKAMEELSAALPQPDGVSKYTRALLDRLSNLHAASVKDEPAHWVELLSSQIRFQDSSGRLYLPAELERLKTREPSRELLNTINSPTTKKMIEDLPKDNSMKTAFMNWALRMMPEFLDKFQKFIDDNKIYYSQEARDAAWNELKAKNAATIEKEFAVTPETEFFGLDPKGHFSIFRNNSKGLAVRFKVGNETVMLPAPFEVQGETGSVPVVTVEDIEIKRVTNEDILPTERYKIVEKTSVGGEPYYLKGKLLSRTIDVIRYSPVINYIEVDKVTPSVSKRNLKPVILLVEDPAEFEAMQVGQEIPIDKLLTMQMVTGKKDTTPMSPTKLQKLPKDKAEALAAKKAAEAAAGKEPEAGTDDDNKASDEDED